MRTRYFLFLALCALCLTACYYKTDSPRGTWARGCDLSWLSEMEHDGVMFYEPSGDQQSDCIALLRGCGMNAVRLRVWVNHSTGWSNKDDVLYLAKRAAQQGQRIMIDFHYSDFFADPQHQSTPRAWETYDAALLCEAVREHTLDVLYALKEARIYPEWVQIGNETPNGMLWPQGRVSNQLSDSSIQQGWDNYAAFTRTGYEAVKEAFPKAQVIVHIDNAYEYRDWFWSALKQHGGRWDMIGLSHYPMMTAWSGIEWQEMNRRAENNIRQLIREQQCPVMICEVGLLDSDPALADRVMQDLLERVEPIDSCAGIFYWEPQCYGGWRPAEYIPLGWGSYNMGAFTPDGRPSPALRRMLENELGN